MGETFLLECAVCPELSGAWWGSWGCQAHSESLRLLAHAEGYTHYTHQPWHTHCSIDTLLIHYYAIDGPSNAYK